MSKITKKTKAVIALCMAISTTTPIIYNNDCYAQHNFKIVLELNSSGGQNILRRCGNAAYDASVNAARAVSQASRRLLSNTLRAYEEFDNEALDETRYSLALRPIVGFYNYLRS